MNDARGRLFDEVWRMLAREGQCDEIGSAEWKRVRSEWLELRNAGVVCSFIVDRANRPGYQNPADK